MSRSKLHLLLFGCCLAVTPSSVLAQATPAAGDDLLVCYQQKTTGKNNPAGPMYVLALQTKRTGENARPVLQLVDQARYFDGLTLQPAAFADSGSITLTAVSADGSKPAIKRQVVATPKEQASGQKEYLSLTVQARENVWEDSEKPWLAGRCIGISVAGSADSLIANLASENKPGQKVIP